MKHLKVTALCMAALVGASAVLSCGSAGTDGTSGQTETEAVETAYHGKVYSIEERKAILLDTTLPLPGSFYDDAVRQRYFDALNACYPELLDPGSVSDEAFAEFEAARDALAVSYRGSYPVICLTLPDTMDKNYRDAQITVIWNGEVIESPITAKIRGNSTANGAKKPYNIKFPDSVSLFGMEEGKKWSLLANMYDRTMLRNRLSLDFAREMGLRYTSECEYCEVWVNGKYRGNYLCCEPVSDGKNRVGIDADKNEFILEVTPFGNWSFVSGEGVPIYYDTPEEPTSAQKKFLTDLIAKAEKAMLTGKESEYKKYIDVGSFVDLYCMMELFKDVDGYHKSLYFYVKDGMLCAGPAWDFDLCCGNVSTTHEEENYYNYHNSHGYGDKSNDSTHGLRMNLGWWKLLLDGSKEFAERVQDRYKELQPMIENLYRDNALGQNRIDRLLEANGASFAREYSKEKDGAGWDIMAQYSIYGGESKGDYDANVAFLRKWLEDRNAWLLEHIGK